MAHTVSSAATHPRNIKPWAIGIGCTSAILLGFALAVPVFTARIWVIAFFGLLTVGAWGAYFNAHLSEG